MNFKWGLFTVIFGLNLNDSESFIGSLGLPLKYFRNVLSVFYYVVTNYAMALQHQGF